MEGAQHQSDHERRLVPAALQQPGDQHRRQDPGLAGFHRPIPGTGGPGGSWFLPVVHGAGEARYDNLRVTAFEGTDFAAEGSR